MVQVVNSKKDCDTCMKSDVCKFKDEYENLYHNIQDDFSCDNTIFEIKLKCKKCSSITLTGPVISTWTPPAGTGVGTNDVLYKSGGITINESSL